MRTAFPLTVAAFVVAALAFSTASLQGQFDYETNNATITITRYAGPGGAVTIPDSTNGFPVTEIGDHAFSGCTNVTTVIIPDAVTNIESGPFSHCSSLAEIRVGALNQTYASEDGILFDKTRTTLLQFPGGRAGIYRLPDAVTAIGTSAFAGCSLSSMTVHSNIATVGQFAFDRCTGLSNVAFASGVITIAARAFDSCTALTSVNLPDTVTSLGWGVFRGCTNLTSATLGTGITDIPSSAFNACASLTSITIPYGVTNIGGGGWDWTWGGGAFGDCTSLTNIAIPDSVISIGSAAFLRCRKLTSITIPNSVTTIGGGAFAECSSLVSASIGSGVGLLDGYAFSGCSSLKAIDVSPANSTYSSLEGVLFNKSQTTLLECPQAKTGAFSVPNSVTNIQWDSFSGCTSLTSVTIPNSVNSIGQSAFEGCSSLTSVTIPNSVDTISAAVFRGCTRLTNAVLGNSVLTMGYGVFEGCPNLAGVYFLGNAPSSSEGVLYGTVTTVYYLPGTTGWGPTFGGRPTALWKPRIETRDGSFGVHTNQFGFNIIWASGRTVVVEACHGLSNPVWFAVATNTLTSGSTDFSDPQWSNYPAGFYRIRSR